MLELKSRKDFLTKLDNNPKNIFILYIYDKFKNLELLTKLNTTSKYGVYIYKLNIINELLVEEFEVSVYPIIRIYCGKQIDEFSIYDDSILDVISNHISS